MDSSITRAEYDEFKLRMEDENRRQNHRIDTLEKTVEQIHALTIAVEKLASSVEQMAQAQAEFNERLKAIENRDGEMWRKAIGYLLTAAAAALVTAIAAKLGTM